MDHSEIRHYFCLDVGGTSTRGAVFDAGGRELARARGVGGALSLGVHHSGDAILQVWQELQELSKEAGKNGAQMQTTSLWAGIAGISLGGRPAELKDKLGGFAQVELVSDGYGALLGATGGKPGALISVGTGVIAQRLHANGKTLALGGWGLPAGDLGGGAWIGLKLFAALSKYFDGVALTPPLPDALVAAAVEVVGRDYEHIHHWHHSASPRDFATLAPLVLKQAERGDGFCLELVERAASEIVLLGRALFCEARPLGERPLIHLAGGLGAMLLAECARQCPEFIWDASGVDPIAGIHLLAVDQAPMEDALTRPGLAKTQQDLLHGENTK